MVTADGGARVVDAENEPDLFWALRGGGGNFGVAASFEFETQPIDMVLGGLVAHPLAAAAEAIDRYRQFTKELPDEATVFCGLVHAPDGSGMKLVASRCAIAASSRRPSRTLRRCASSALRSSMSSGRCPTRSSTRCSTTRSPGAR